MRSRRSISLQQIPNAQARSNVYNKHIAHFPETGESELPRAFVIIPQLLIDGVEISGIPIPHPCAYKAIYIKPIAQAIEMADFEQALNSTLYGA